MCVFVSSRSITRVSRHWSCYHLDLPRWTSCHMTNSALQLSREFSEATFLTGEQKKLQRWWNQHSLVSVKLLPNYRVHVGSYALYFFYVLLLLFYISRERMRMTVISWNVAVRPWLYDDFDDWLQQLNRQPYKSAFIFVDNSGVDIILGIFPFARLLLKHGTHVSILRD